MLATELAARQAGRSDSSKQQPPPQPSMPPNGVKRSVGSVSSRSATPQPAAGSAAAAGPSGSGQPLAAVSSGSGSAAVPPLAVLRSLHPLYFAEPLVPSVRSDADAFQKQQLGAFLALLAWLLRLNLKPEPAAAIEATLELVSLSAPCRWSCCHGAERLARFPMQPQLLLATSMRATCSVGLAAAELDARMLGLAGNLGGHKVGQSGCGSSAGASCAGAHFPACGGAASGRAERAGWPGPAAAAVRQRAQRRGSRQEGCPGKAVASCRIQSQHPSRIAYHIGASHFASSCRAPSTRVAAGMPSSALRGRA
jgi:hypothetical protein